jgi:hypothetical protein
MLTRSRIQEKTSGYILHPAIATRVAGNRQPTLVFPKKWGYTFRPVRMEELAHAD